jgi:hypothetical protein
MANLQQAPGGMMLGTLQDRIYELLEAANTVLPASDSLFYGGTFLSGTLDRPDFLFLGINPGQGAWDARPRTLDRVPFRPTPCKFAEESDGGGRLAGKIVDIVLGGDPSRLAACAETSVRSFFATPDEGILNRQLALLRPSGLAHRHQALMTDALPAILQAVAPRQIVCIGLTTFQRFTAWAGIRADESAMKSVPSTTGKTEPVYYKRASINGVPVHGVLHLSGGRLSTVMEQELRAIFAATLSSSAAALGADA